MNWQMIVAELMKYAFTTEIVHVRVDGRMQRLGTLAANYYDVDTDTFDVTGYVRERARIARLAWIRERIS